jgi:DNA-binding XRE family transcriptional regulator
MTCRELGAKAGVNGSTIFAYECGRVLPSLTVAVRLAKVLGISMDELTEGKG